MSNFEALPVSGEYLHRDCYDASKKYGKDIFIVINKLGAKYIPRLFAMKRVVDRIAEKIKFLPTRFSDKIMQYMSYLWPNHLPKRMEQYHDKYEHHWIVEVSGAGIDETRTYLDNFFEKNEGDYFECTRPC